MEKYELDNVLENYFVPGQPPPKPKKEVKFNERVAVQWPEDAERLRREASLFIAKRKEAQDARLLNLVYQMEGRHRGKSDEDPGHPNFPFPLDFKRINFDVLDPYKLYCAAEYLRQEKRKLEEPFFQHTNKMKAFEELAEAATERELERIAALPIPRGTLMANQSRLTATSTNPFFPLPLPYYSPSFLDRDWGSDSTESSSSSSLNSSTLLFAQMNRPGGKVKKEPGFYPKPPELKLGLAEPRTGTSALAMRNVAVWIKSNFDMPPPPVQVHPLKDAFPGPRPSIVSDLPYEPSTYSVYPEPPIKGDEPKEVHVLNGIVMAPNSFNETVGNSFAENYDTSGFKDNDDYTQNWVPHRFRCSVRMKDYKDSEVSIYFRRPCLIFKGEIPRTMKHAGQKEEETVEVPDWVLVKNLKFFRLPRQGMILVEEVGRRREHANVKLHPEALATIKRYLNTEYVRNYPNMSEIIRNRN